MNKRERAELEREGARQRLERAEGALWSARNNLSRAGQALADHPAEPVLRDLERQAHRVSVELLGALHKLNEKTPRAARSRK